jgi:hypothetical protein
VFKLIIFTFPFFSLAQEEFEYMGLIQLNDSTSITYKVALSELNGIVKGYSMTDLGGEHETRSSILGEYDKANNELNFRETSIIYTKSPVIQQDFCFINTTFKKFSFEKGKKIKANFVGLFSDNTRCIDGQLLLNSVEKVETKLDKMVSKINKSKKVSDSTKQKINSLRLMDSLNLNILKKNQTLSVFSNSKNVTITIYDGGKADGDKITIMVNGKPYLTNYEAKSDKKILTLNLIEDKTSFVIEALNEGSIKPNTVVVELDDHTNTIKALSNLKTGETTRIDILKTN